MGFVNCEVKDKIAVVTINRPEALNALNSQVLDELGSAFDGVDLNEIRCIVLTGAGEKSFVAGADISEMKRMSEKEAYDYAMLGAQLFQKIEYLDKVTIAAINGFALGGGCELAMACDFRIASEKAKLGQPEVGLGITPGFSGIRRMMELVGEAKAKEYIFSGRMFDANEALRIGLVNKIVAPKDLMEEVKNIAAEIASKSFNAVITSKRVMNAMKGNADEAVKLQSEHFASCFNHPDQKTGMTAFLNKEKPVF